MNNLILIASFPPPVAGQSIATRMLIDDLNAKGVRFELVNLSKTFNTENRALGILKRVWRVAALPVEVLARSQKFKGNGSPILYLQLGQSPQAMLRDLPLISLAAVNGWPLVLHVHGSSFRAAYDESPFPLRAAVKRALSYADRVVVLSESLKSLFNGLVDDARIEVIANGVEQELFSYAQLSRPKLFNRDDILQVLFLNNLIETKGYLTVLETALLAQQRNLPIRFVFAGQVTETTHMHPQAYIDRHGLENAKFVGPVYGQAKLELFEESDVFVLPTFRPNDTTTYSIEGQPISILEAMHFGLVVVTTAEGGIVDIIEDRVNGFLIPSQSPENLLDTLVEVASNTKLRGEISERNRNEASNRYTAEIHGLAMCELFESVSSIHNNKGTRLK